MDYGRPSSLVLIGRKECVDFPDWGLTRIRAKIDTGAYSSALDIPQYEIVEKPRDATLETTADHWVRFVLSWRPKQSQELRIVEVPLLRTVRVTNPGGRQEFRPVVETTLLLGNHARSIRMTLTCRAGMRHRVLLGRQALTGFAIDVSQKYLLTPRTTE